MIIRQEVPPRIRGFARDMRRDATLAENILWQAIRNSRLDGLKFKRQVPLLGYIVDFACLRQKLVVELDGAQHSASQKDVARDARLKQAGFKILRFWNDDVLDNLDGVCSQVLREAKPESDSPLL